jgi:hypothetical protein
LIGVTSCDVMIAPRTRTAMLAAIPALAALASCPRRQDRPAVDSEAGVRPTAAAPRSLVPRYRGAADFTLTFFDDCHCEFDGEDSVRYSKRYAFDETRGLLWISGIPPMESRADGRFVEAGGRDAGLWDRLAGEGWWDPVDDQGSATRRPRPRFPDACRCAGDSCRRVGPK